MDISIQPGRYLVDVGEAGYRLWNISALDQYGVLLPIMADLNAQADADKEAALAEFDTEEFT